MERIRKPFQGVKNIIRFNWHFYVLSFIAILLLLTFSFFIKTEYRFVIFIVCALAILVNIVSLSVSFYIYDLSDLYELKWLNKSVDNTVKSIVNIHAGFDETSALLHKKYPQASLRVLDFYDEKKHTEVSIKRARKAYPAFSGTEKVSTSLLPLQNDSADIIFLIFAAHEIRNDEERIIFFKETDRVLKQDGIIVVTEHLRDVANFFAYTIGFFHFLSKPTWLKTFVGAGLKIDRKIKITPFITTYILSKNGTID
jgi:SAM-dependent methyltransferase